jgi:hypothetical protein
VNELRPFTLCRIQQPAELRLRIGSLPISHIRPQMTIIVISPGSANNEVGKLQVCNHNQQE